MKRAFLLVTLFALFLGVSQIHAWVEPTLPPTGGNVTAPLRLDASGNLGIGVTTAGAKLDIARPGNANVYENGIRVNRPDAIGNYAFVGYGQTSSVAYFGSTYVGAAGSYGQIYFRQYSQAGAFRDALSIISSGNVGIGITTPLSKLQVVGDLTTNPTTGTYAQIEATGLTNSNNRLSLGYNTTGDYGVIQALRNATGFRNLILQPGGSNLGVGNVAPAYKLDVTGDVNVTGCYRVAGTCLGSSSVGTGTVGVLSKWVTGSTLGNSRLSEQADGSVRTTSPTGWTDIGPKNASYNHIYTDRPATIFNTSVYAGTAVDNSIFSAYGTNNLRLQTNGVDRITTLATNGNVGIGTAAPAAKLDVNARANGSGYGLFVDTTTRTTGEEYVRFGDTTSADFMVNSTGNVGIGTIAPTQRLSVNGNINKLGSWIVSDLNWAAGNLEVHNNLWDGVSNNNYGGVIGGKLYAYRGLQSGGATGAEATDGQLYVAGNSMLMGNVGVGITNPTSQLSVADGTGLRVYSTATGAGTDISYQGGISTNSVYVAKSGNIGTGGTTGITSITQDGNAIQAVSWLVGGSGVIAQGASGATSRGVTGSAQDGYGVYGASTFGYGIYCAAAGTGFCGGTRAWTNTSDIRLKKNISTITSGLDKVLKLRGVNYTWKNDGTNKKNIGFIAQEIMEVLPEVVNKNNEGYYTVNESSVNAVLVEAVKELKAENDDLKARLERLEAKVK